jgi:isopenicillin-N N-acyltransferase like protein
MTLQGQLGDETKASRGAHVTPDELCRRAMLFVPAFEEWAPSVLEEIKGVAAGARVPFAEALLANVRGEVGNVSAAQDGCSAFAVSRTTANERQILLGQNSDQDAEFEPLAVVLHVVPDDAPSAIMITFAGLVGYHGLNEFGVAHGANAVSVGTWRMGLPHYPFKRMILEQESVEEVVTLARRLPLCSGGNYVVCDGAGRIADLEIIPERDGVRVLEPEHGLVVHTNHLLHPDFAPRDRLVGLLPDSPTRLDVLHATLSNVAESDGLSGVMSALQQHCDDGKGICRHEPGMKTILSFVADAAGRALYARRGNACSGPYTRYSISSGDDSDDGERLTNRRASAATG